MITIQYKCWCMKEQVDLQVRERLPNEDIRKWVEYMGLMIAGDHQTHSPLCMRTTMEYAKIPWDGDNAPIGSRPVRQNN